MKWVFLCGAIIGAALPLGFLAQFFMANGFDAVSFWRQLSENNVAMFFAMDVVVSAVMLWTLVFTEGRRQRMDHLWVYVLCTCLVGVSLALPLFLFFRERKLSSAPGK